MLERIAPEGPMFCGMKWKLSGMILWRTGNMTASASQMRGPILPPLQISDSGYLFIVLQACAGRCFRLIDCLPSKRPLASQRVIRRPIQRPYAR